MDEMTVFEQRFEDRVRTFARTGVRPVDSAAVAHAVAVEQPRVRRAGSSVRWHGLQLDRRGWTIAVALGLLVALLGGALVVGARLLLQPPFKVSPAITNGWIAFTVGQPAPNRLDGGTDIWFAALEEPARRVVGTDTDGVDQLCPSFSPDGRSLAYGRVEGHGAEHDADGVTEPATYQNAALVVADVADDGTVADRLTIDVGDGLPPPCPLWSPDGEQVAFGVNRTSPINPQTSAAGSEVWVVTLADRGITVLPDLLATDLEWSPDGRLLAIASGKDELVSGNGLHDGRIYLYEPTSGTTRLLDGASGAVNLTWSPDGRRIAWAGIAGEDDSSLELRLIDVETGHQKVLAAGYEAIHGIGPVWSPDGETIAYQRCLRSGCGGERHEVVLVAPDDPSDEGAIPEQVVIPFPTAPLFPSRVTWSPDGEYLLYYASTLGGYDSLVAIPADMNGPPVVVAHIEGTVSYDGYPDTTLVPIQTWGRSPIPSPTPQPSVATTTSAAENLLNRFLEARVVGEGAGEFVNDRDEDIPLLYATTSGAPYERAEFERVPDIEWPYGWTAFKVRMFAGDTVVEQLYFTSSDDPIGINYVPDGYGTEIAPTTEDAEPVGAPYNAFDGEVTLYIAHPWVSRFGSLSIKLIPEGPGVAPTTDGGERNGWNSLVVMADPARSGAGCPMVPGPADAEDLARSLRSDPGLKATAPVSVGARGADGLVMDVEIAARSDRGDPGCRGISGVTGGMPWLGGSVYLSAGERMRLYLFDAPEGSSMRTLAIAIVVPESQFERAAPALDSVQFHAP